MNLLQNRAKGQNTVQELPVFVLSTRFPENSFPRVNSESENGHVIGQEVSYQGTS
jgi:hypothetical protein